MEYTKKYSKCFFNQSLLELYPIWGQTSFCILEVLLLNGLKEDKQLLLHLHYLWNEVLMYTYVVGNIVALFCTVTLYVEKVLFSLPRFAF